MLVPMILPPKVLLESDACPNHNIITSQWIGASMHDNTIALDIT